MKRNILQKNERCVSKRQHTDCKKGQAPCNNLDHLFLCKNGLCQNITSVFDCQYNRVQSPPLNCKDKRNCITLEGLYDCKNGMCSKVSDYYIDSKNKPINQKKYFQF